VYNPGDRSVHRPGRRFNAPSGRKEPKLIQDTHLYTILAFALLLWRADQGVSFGFGVQDPVFSAVFVLVQPPLFGLLAVFVSRRARALFRRDPQNPQTAQFFHHWATVVLRLGTAAGFAASVFFTRWPEWFDFRETSCFLQVAGDLITVSPFIASIIALWIGAFPLERDIRREALLVAAGAEEASRKGWKLSSYLDFHIRHHILIVAVPMTLIVFAFNVTDGYEEKLLRLTGWPWTSDVVVGGAALAVFVVAPLMLKRIWRTHPLGAGPLRDQLQSVCDRIGLKCRDILVWNSDGMVINAAVMGIFSRVRYVLLSDGLLEAMSPLEIEAVFGHEAGHVREHHMQHFLIFAYVGSLIAGGVMEGLLRITLAAGHHSEATLYGIQALGAGVAVILWLWGFGWISRRFERQADLFGARCVSPPAEACHVPCSMHLGSGGGLPGSGRVCATGAAVFASALDRVAVLNGIPHEERSWRHSSIATRMRFLISLSGDPRRTRHFERLVLFIKRGILICAIVGSVLALVYYVYWAEPPVVIRWVPVRI
jgi:STE24 endopeptidase